ncbi:hypothetical protein [Extensimonas sp. H3M7-6]|uniref:hypothetical protein n=1 Tax=Extensimonas soli TaxID=3031322 RepID=UPI0023DC6A96|nr:hypothetical protein [Extensimonas sp. H3M7-6]MDF1483481.1 hypothetical protein [Extensimonas sp. H3M7-6]
MDTLLQVLAKAPSEAWVGLLGVVFGSLLTTLGVWLTNRANAKQLKVQLVHEERVQNQRVSKERLEELYVLVCRWLNGMFSNYLHLTLVMKGECDYNAYLDAVIKASADRPVDFSRIEMIIGIYGAEIRQAYDQVIEARTRVNSLISDHKQAYLQGKPGTPFLGPFTSVQVVLEQDCEALKEAIARAARGA